MKDSTAIGLFIAGIVLNLMGVGSIEHSVDDIGLVSGLLLSIVGLLIMAVSVQAIKVNDATNYYK